MVNRTSRIVSITAAGITAAGCAGSPAAISMMSAEKLAIQKSVDLCNSWSFSGHSTTGKVYSELQQRNELTPDEWKSAKDKEIFIGMSELGLICSWGYPGTYGDINESNYGSGTERQWVYRSSSYTSASYVYTKHGKVTAWN